MVIKSSRNFSTPPIIKLLTTNTNFFMLKKLLIISSYSPPSIGGAQILYNHLRGYPVNRYIVLTSFYKIDNISAQKGTWLEGEYVFYDNLKAKKLDRTNIRDAKRTLLNKLKGLIKRVKIVRNILGIPIIFSQIYLIKKQGVKMAKNFDTMLGISDYGPAIISTYLIHKKTKIPYSIYLFDLYKGNYYPFPGGILSKIYEKRILNNAEHIIVTNQGTKDFYIKRYDYLKNKITVIYNSVDPFPYINLPEEKYSPKSPYTILFTGNVSWPQARSIKNLVEAVDEMKDINLEMYCPNGSYLKKIGINYNLKVASPQEIPNIQRNADILFLPLSWETKGPEIIKTATPGKLTTYLISGKPILIHAPRNTALTNYTKSNNFACVVAEESKEGLQQAIRKIVSDINYSQSLINNAKKTFFKNHDATKNVHIFNSLFEL